MGISHTAIGRRLSPFTTAIERGRLEFFAEAIGQADPIYSNLDAAHAAGHPDLPVPPTFIFGLRPAPLDLLKELGVDLRYVLHGTQRFTYDAVPHAGDLLTFAPVIEDIYEKKGGALEFIVTVTSVTDSGGRRIAQMHETLVVRHPELEGK